MRGWWIGAIGLGLVGCAATQATAAKPASAPGQEAGEEEGGADSAQPQADADERADPHAGERPLPHLAPRALLPQIMQDTLSARMGRHGEVMSFLLQDVVLLQYESAEELAETLAEEPQLGRPHPSDHTSLNALLPPSFFVYQDRLKERAQALAEAARTRDDGRLGRAFGALTETCVGCHSAYLYEEVDAELPDTL